MANNVKITSKGIQKILKKYNTKQAIAEYIWNGFDAKANKVEVNFETNDLDSITHLMIKDNGYGINLDELQTKFNPFYESEKAIEISSPKHTSVMHGKNGVGRLTFFTFANSAKWETTYKVKDQLNSGSITINVNGLNNYTPEKFDKPTQTRPGTSVSFSDIEISKQEIESSIIPFLIREFGWFLELNKSKGYVIKINGTSLDYTENIVEQKDDITIYYEPVVHYDLE